MSRCFLPEAQVPDRGQNFRDDVEQVLAPLQEAVSRGNFDTVGNMVEVMDDENRLAISMNVAQFTPEQLSVDIDGRVLTIEGKQENEESNGSFMRPPKAALLERDDSSGKTEKVVNDDYDSKLSISLNVKKFKPEELSVNLDGRTLKIEGKQEIKEKNGYTMRTFVRQGTLPKEIDVEQLKSTLTGDGHLAVEAPKITKKPPTSRSIEIQKETKPVKKNGEVNKQ